MKMFPRRSVAAAGTPEDGDTLVWSEADRQWQPGPAGGGSGGGGDFEFEWDTPGITDGVDTGIVLPAGSAVVYGSDWFSFTEEFDSTGVGNITFAFGSGPDIGDGASVDGADGLQGAASPHPVPLDDPAWNDNPAFTVAHMSGILANQTIYFPEEVHLWMAVWAPVGGVLNAGAGAYHIRSL